MLSYFHLDCTSSDTSFKKIKTKKTGIMNAVIVILLVVNQELLILS